MIEVFGPFVLILAVIFIAIQVYLREGRNPVLEGMIEHGEIGPLTRFRGSLDIEEHRPGVFLRLSKKSRLAGQLQFRYRWLVGIGPQARYDDVTFDVSKGSVELTDRGKRTTLNFSDISGVRMREVAAGRGGGSIWHVELLRPKLRAIPFVTSEMDDRQTSFERTAPLTKAVSSIMAVRALVFVAGNIWTPGWPPKSPQRS